MKVTVSGLSLLPAPARSAALIARACRAALALERARPRGELSVVVVGRSRMLALNKRYLRRAHDTDVIAFRYEDAPVPDAPFGDVFISAFQARRQARELGHPLLVELLTLAAHGTLHLLGYDDDTPRRRAEMFRRQDAVLAKLGHGKAPARR